ncbi:hypothetical protein [Rhizobium acidisoli]|uniref:hypothetical protein n=1 Tax=Rhizobium acidisoli TaxID=1538158 RepID=UPI000ABAF6E3|nr:hypothetical protein [Rhizobium acidisoli]
MIIAEKAMGLSWYSNWIVPDGDLPACVAYEAHYPWGNPNWSIARPIRYRNSASKFFRRNEKRRVRLMQRHVHVVEMLRPASSMDDDGCGICDECLAP